MLTPLARRVFSRIRRLNRSKAFGAIMRLISGPVAQAQQYIAADYSWVVDLDLEKFFDRVNHDKLVGQVAKRVEDMRLLKLIRRNLQHREAGFPHRHQSSRPSRLDLCQQTGNQRSLGLHRL
jgi:hypothetical protein